ncbi:MAG: twin-arginine translocase subunit TatC [Candidatus Levybacteria bacterium]|nr:twin-arginine translocase subunit TatC [Candidatus Levybacteria bacterium]
MKKILLSLFGLFALFPLVVFAQEGESIDPCINNPELSTCQASSIQIGEALGTVIQFIFVIAVILALGFLVYGGIRWITSGGDKSGVETARNTIIASIIGLIIVFLAYVILNLVLTFLTGEDISQVKIPTLQACTVKSRNPDGTVLECNQPEDGSFSCISDPDNDNKSCKKA